MKTITSILILIFFISVNPLSAGVDSVYAHCNKMATNVCFHLEEEMYIDDIPFDTKAVAVLAQQNDSYIAALAVDFEMEEEEYIEDIPFRTAEIFERCLGNKHLHKKTLVTK
ncbi:MAG: hypothetical protein KAT48_06435 [Bacteroidales bacterium]|nr:hypothetical protein [Bacteroidales bacterium]